MPSINDSRKIIETTIPEIEGSKVTLWDTLTVGDMEKVGEGKNEVERTIVTLLCLIKEWNLDDALTAESIRKLSVTATTGLMQQTAFYKDALKTMKEKEEEETEKKTV